LQAKGRRFDPVYLHQTMIIKKIKDLEFVEDPEIIADVDAWIDRVGTRREELDGHAICPYAIGARSEVFIAVLPYPEIFSIIENFTMVVFIDSDERTFDELKMWTDEIRKHNQDLIIVVDHMSNPTYLRGIQTNNGKRNAVVFQPKKQGAIGRHQMEKTGWFDLWTDKEMNRLHYARNVNTNSDYE